VAGSEAVPNAVEQVRGRAAFAAARNPYVGPRPLELGERLWGRDEEVSALYFLLSAERIVLLHSPSGAGKSSLVQAGLIPRLREAFDVWRPTRVNQEPGVAAPAGRPLNRYVHSAILGFEEGIPQALRRPAAELAGLTLAEYAAGRPKRPGAPPSSILIFDQFEEVLTVDPLALAAKRELFDQLGALLRDPHIWALFVLRDDYLAPLDPYANRVPTHLKNRFRIDLLGLAAAREAIVNPARPRKFPAADKLVHDLATMKVQQPDGSFVEQTGNHVEPVQLQVVCRRLWEAMPKDDPSIDEADLERFGSVDKALAGYYANAVEGIAAGDLGRERAIRDWVGERLITPGGIRGQVLRSARESEGLANDLIEQLRATHLVRAEKRAGATWYELAHDRLIKPVREDNAVWREEHLNTVQQRAALWESQSRPAGLLLAAEELAEAEAWAAVHEAALTAMERRYLAASAEAVAAALQEAFQVSRIQRLAVAATILAAVALVAGGFAGWEWWKAKETACRAQDLARGGVGASLLATQPLQAGLVLLEVRGTEQAGPTAEALHRALAVLAGKRGAETSAILRHEGDVVAASFSPDGKHVVTASADGTARLWDAATGKSWGRLFVHTDAVNSASFSPDGRVVTASSDGMARLWDTATGKKLFEWQPHAKRVNSTSFSPDGSRIVTVSSDKTARLWDAAGNPLVKLEGHEKGVVSASFSKDGRRIVTASFDRTARLWDVSTGKQIGEPLRHEDAVRFAAFSPDGRRVVTASRDGAARVWDVATRKSLGEPLRPGAGLRSASFSRDGKWIITASEDETARVWDIATGQEIAILGGHTAAVRFASFSPDGSRIVTASADGTARLWKIRNSLLKGEELAVLRDVEGRRFAGAVFNPDGSRILTASLDAEKSWTSVWDTAVNSRVSQTTVPCRRIGAISLSQDGRYFVSLCRDGNGTAQIRDTSSGAEVALSASEKIRTASLSPDGSLLVTTAQDNLARIRDVRSREPIAKLPGHLKEVTAAVFSPDGAWIATASADKTARLWNAKTFEPTFTLTGHGGSVGSVSFSLDGARIVTASADQTARIWSTATGELLFILKGHGAEATTAAFSPDGKRIVTVSEENARLWNAEKGELLAILQGHGDRITAASFSPDGTRILTASADGTVRLWANISDYTSYLLGRLRTRNESCLEPAVRVDALGETEEAAEHQFQVCKDCVPVFFERLGKAPESRPESYVEAWRAYRECRETR
jgi:WD40 repeat protein